MLCLLCLFCLFIDKSPPFFFNLFIFRERGREGEREGEKHQCVVASHAPLLGTCPATQACALTGNQTGNPLVLRPALNPLSHTIQGKSLLVITLVLACLRDQDDCPEESNKYLLRACCVSGAVLGAGDTAVDKTDTTKSPPSESRR